MNANRLAPIRSAGTRAAILLLFAIPAHAQVPATSASDLAKYDTNKNGRLDPEEIAARDAAPRNGAENRPIVISPFEVRADGRGYYASNTMSGTRLNSKVEDLAASLTVVTKEQMADFAMLDINDIFLYEAGTEGTGNYTEFEFDRNGTPVDNTQLEPLTANRIRGVGNANISFGNFETSGRVPIDPINIEAVEIGRGPNSTVFGLGNAAGSVNMVPASANLGRDRTELGTRVDSFGGHRASLDLSRVLKKGVLAVRGTVVYQHDGFDLKPSGTDSTRFTGMVTFRPFKNTTLRGSWERYHIAGNRPNTSMPRDYVSRWIEAGKPSYNPVTQRVTLNGALLPTTYTNATIGSTGYFTTFNGVNTVYVNPDGTVGYWQQSRSTASTTDPDAAKQDKTLVLTVAPSAGAGQPLFATTVPPVFSKDLYDWTSINLAATNHLNETTVTKMVELEQVFLNTPRQTLAMQMGVFREDSQKFRREFLGANTDVFSGNLYVDPNEVRLDGTPNPYFGRTYLGVRFPTFGYTPLYRQTSRVQLAYRLDLTHEKNILRWLGTHQILGYGEYKNRVQRRVVYRDAILSDHAWLARGVNRANTAAPASPNVTRSWFNYYVGDNVGTNVDYAPRDFSPGVYDFHWGNGVTGAFFTEPALLGPAETANQVNTVNTNNRRELIKTQGGSVQSHFLAGRVITTFGLRRDSSYNRFGATPLFLPDGIHTDPALADSWAAGDWATIRSGQTKTAGVVVRPLPWFSVHLNKSDSFQPIEVKYDLYLKPLPDPAGRGEDYGFALNLFGGKLVAKFNQYETRQTNARSATPQIPGRTRAIDFETTGFITADDPFNLVERATRWITTANPTLPRDQINQQVSTLTGLSLEHILTTDKAPGDFANTGDVVAKGKEIEINYNPSNFWTVKLNVTEQESVDKNLSASVTEWINERMPYWTTIVDPEYGVRFWDNPAYSPGRTPHSWFDGAVPAPLAVAQATEGKSKPQIRKYRANLSTRFGLAGITDRAILKRFSVGGAVRWIDKGAIGYYGVQTFPAPITALDPNRPVWDKARSYFDAFVSYRTRLYSDRVGATFQLNVRNLQEGGRLEAIRALPNGVPSALRIIPPRQFIFSAKFDL